MKKRIADVWLRQQDLSTLRHCAIARLKIHRAKIGIPYFRHMRFQILVFLFLLPFITLAQPGGGGGASFQHFGVPGKDYTSELCLKHMKLQLMSGVHSNIIDSEQKEIRSLNLEHNSWSSRYAGQEYHQSENHYRLVWKEDKDSMQLIKKNEEGLKVADECIRLEPKDPRGFLLKSMFYNDIRTEDAMKKAEEYRIEFRNRLESFKFKFHY